MKRTFVTLATFLSAVASFAQLSQNSAKVAASPIAMEAIFSDANIPSYFIPLDRTTTIVSPEPILYVDISSNKIEGDLSAATGNKVFRLKPVKDCQENEVFTVSVVTERMVAMYRLTARQSDSITTNVYVIAVNPATAWRLNDYNTPSSADFEKLSFHALTRKRGIFNIKSKEKGMEGWINNIYTAGEYILIDVGVKNHTNIPFDVSEVRCKILDKYALSAHVSQELELTPLFQFNDNKSCNDKSGWRNFYVFRKFTYPDNKVFQIEINEAPVSGRCLRIQIDYNQLLQAKMLQ